MDNKILKIKSKYNRKLLFSYLKYNFTLKLIKYNKLCQKDLDITKQNYETFCHYNCYEKKIEIDRLSDKTMENVRNEYRNPLIYLLFFCILLQIIFYIIF